MQQQGAWGSPVRPMVHLAPDTNKGVEKMRVLHGCMMVLWTRQGWPGVAFPADWRVQPDEDAASALRRYRSDYPEDVVLGVKDATGRFVA